MAPRRRVGRRPALAAETVEGAALALEGVHHVHGGHGLPASVLSVGDRVADDVLQENLEDAAGLLVDESRDTLHTATASKAADRGLGDALDVIAEYLTVALGATLTQTLTALSASRHVACGCGVETGCAVKSLSCVGEGGQGEFT